MKVESPIALIAGSGGFPIEVARAARAEGIKVCVIAHKGETDPAIGDFADRLEWIRVGQLGKLLRLVSRFEVRQAIFCGGISRTSIFRGARPDLRALQVLARAGRGQDDAILRAIAAEVERLGVSVVSCGLLLPEWIARSGTLTQRGLSAIEGEDARLGWRAAKLLGQADIGQTVVVSDGTVVALEGIEGTDECIRRAGLLTAKRGAVVVKVAKPQQDRRLDLPAVGEGTLAAMRDAGVTALVLEHEGALIRDPVGFVREADRAGISVSVLRGPEAILP